jgi:hypothetical protein
MYGESSGLMAAQGGGLYQLKANGPITRGEVQPLEYRDKWFAVIFWGHLATLIIYAILFAAGAIKLTSGGNNGRRFLQSDAIDDWEVQDAIFFFSNLAIAFIVAPILTLVTMTQLGKHAILITKTALIGSLVLNAVFFIVSLFTEPLMGIFFGLMLLLLGCYVYAVWNRIPFAAANLQTAIAAMQSNKGIALMSLLAIPVAIIYTILWAYILLMMSETQWYGKHIVTETDEAGHTVQHADGILNFVYSLLIISFYWSMQVIVNVVHTTVAGTVGTWWFVPNVSQILLLLCFTFDGLHHRLLL